MLRPPTPALCAELRSIVGAAGWIEDAADQAPYWLEQRGLFESRSAAVVCPDSTEQVAQVLRACHAASVGVVPQGGNTGLCGGSVAKPDQILLSLRRLRRIRVRDAIGATLVVEAGCLLADVQAAAREMNQRFALSLAAEGSCTIGGNLATNAGGTNALRYGVARDQVLGLEVVLADGTVWPGLSALKKDNSGYDLRNLMIGSEGTLGVITAATLKLHPAPSDVQTAWVALREPAQALALLQHLQQASDGRVNACELISARALSFVTQHFADLRAPLATNAPWALLIEISSGGGCGALAPLLEQSLAQAQAAGELIEAVIAQSQAQAQALWQLRERIPEAQKREGGSIKHDVSVPLAALPLFLAQATAAVEAALPGARVCAFGHVGDGNIHFNVSQPPGAERAAFLAQWARCNRIVHDLVATHHGAFSAEHGIGRLKRDELLRYKSPAAVAMMRAIKAALDPRGILNPGALLA